MNTRASEGKERRRRRFRRDDESGLTTLEWLLIVAAVAGLAALAVVLVTQVVEDTSEQISGNNARQTAAQLAAADINRQALAAAGTGESVNTDAEWDSVANGYARRCTQLEIIYGDIEGIDAHWTMEKPTVSAVIATALTQWGEAMDDDSTSTAVDLSGARGAGATVRPDSGCTVAVP